MEQKLYDIKSRQKMKIKKRKEAMVQLLEQVSDVVLTDLFLMADPEYYFNRYSEDARRGEDFVKKLLVDYIYVDRIPTMKVVRYCFNFIKR